jgi:GNAT superfamily N-acetyltransferase
MGGTSILQGPSPRPRLSSSCRTAELFPSCSSGNDQLLWTITDVIRESSSPRGTHLVTSDSGRFLVERVTAEDTRALRHEVLRAGHPFASTRYGEDDNPSAAHFAIRVAADPHSGELVAVGSVFPDPPPWHPEHTSAWRIRGMATSERMRGQGLGRKVLDSLVDYSAEHGGTMIWCHARAGALEFYRRAGFSPIGAEFHDGITLHRSMWRPL